MPVSISGAGSISGLDQGFNVTTGSVGVGTTNPRTDLQVGAFGGGDSNIQLATGTSGASNILFGDSSAGSNYYKGFIKYNHSTDNLELYTTDDLIHYTGGSERLRISSSGNVGINDTSPAALFTVNNGTNDSQCVFIKNDNVGAYFGTYGTGHASYPREVTINGTRTDGDSYPFLRIAGQGGIKFCVDLNTERLRIDSSGRVGINETAPDRTLHVNSGATDTALKLESTDTEVSIELTDNTGSSYIGGGGNYLNFYSGGNERLRIDSVGKFLIGPGAIANPKVTTVGAIDTSNSDWAIVMGGSGSGNRANNATKDGRFAGAHYTNAEEPIGLVRSYSTSSANEVHIGGGSSLINAATQLSFYTATNTTTTGGTERLRIKSNGHVHIGNPIELANVATTTHTFALSGNSDNTFSCPGSVSISGATAYNTASYAGGGLRFLGKYNASGQYTTFAHVGGIKENTIDGNYAGALTFHTRNHGGLGAERMRISSNGQVTMPVQPCFFATSNNGGSNTSTGYTGIFSNQLEHAYVNIGNHYNTSTGIFTCPVAGTYEFHGQGLIRWQGSNGRAELSFYKNGSNTISRSYGYTYVTGTSDHDNLHVMGYITCAANDQIDLRVSAMDSGVDCYFAQGLGYFAGRLVQ